MNSGVSLCTLNVNGFRNTHKRKSIIRILKQNKYDIICLQETHVLNKDRDGWEREWGGLFFSCSNTNQSKGQITLFRKGFPYKVSTIFSSERTLTSAFETEMGKVNIINTYAPTIVSEKPSYFESLFKHVMSLEGEIILCGDFNNVLCNELDIISGEPHRATDVEIFRSLVINCCLNDSWRLFHPDQKEYSWCRKNPFIARRLDYILISDTVFDRTVSCDIMSMPNTDHRMIVINFRCSQMQRGPSTWKFNDSLLHDCNFVDLMNNFLQKFKEENDNLNSQMKWDMCKIKIRDMCIEYSKSKKTKQKSYIKDLQNELNTIESKLSQDTNNNDLLLRRETIKKELEIFSIQESKSAQIRSRVKFIEEGEKNTKYFLNLEKARGNGKIMDSLKTPQGKIITSRQDIMNEQVRHFKETYSKCNTFNDAQAEEFMKHTDTPKIREEDKQMLDEELTINEITYALKEMRNSSAPGSDGLTNSFLKFFWLHINDMIVDSFNAAYEAGEMSILQKQAVITLIHKGKDLSRDELVNWRPISLTNTDYKLLAKTLALRLAQVIKDIVNEDQVGFIKGRRVSNMIRLIDDTIDFMNIENKPGLLLAIDYKRAFDSISKDFILWSFKRFGFGEHFIKWVKVLMNNTESTINYMGWRTESIPVLSGVRQGCPFSPLAFVIALEMLAIRIRNDSNIKGIELPISSSAAAPTSLLKILLYADDITMFLKDHHDMKRVLETINSFSKISNLSINKNKTEAMWLGSKKYSTENYFDIKWKQTVKIVGIFFNNATPASLIEQNWSNRLNKIQELMARWSKRNLSLSGKMCIIKTFLLSQMIYVIQSLYLPEHVLNKLNTLLFRFLWKKKFTNTRAFEKVKRTVLCASVEKGGLNMINICTMQSSFLVAWAFELQKQPDSKWTNIPNYIFSRIGMTDLCFQANVPANKFIGYSYIKSSFWSKVLKIWLDNKIHLNLVEKAPYMGLWNNTDIKYRKRTLFFKDWIQAHIYFVSDIVTNEGLISFQQVNEIVGPKPSRLFEYNAICTALHAQSAAVLMTLPIKCHHHYTNSDIKYTPTARNIRALLVSSIESQPHSCMFWNRKYGITITETHWSIAVNSTKEERLRLLHWKILHNIFPTNILLNKMGVKNSVKCDFCNENDYIEHFFFHCMKIKKIWKLCEEYILLKTGEKVVLKETDSLFGYCTDRNTPLIHFINHVILICKMVISKYRYGKGFNLTYLFEYETKIRDRYLLHAFS